MKKPCLVRDCPNLAERSRCPAHESEYQRRRNADPARAAYLDPKYKRSRKSLIDGRIPCEWCGIRVDLTVDHRIPLSHGGTNDPENLRVLCRRCNSKKGHALERAVESDRETR